MEVKKKVETNIFTEIMNLIEKNTNIPMLEKDIAKWILEDKNNKYIYEIYKIASKAREI